VKKVCKLDNATSSFDNSLPECQSTLNIKLVPKYRQYNVPVHCQIQKKTAGALLLAAALAQFCESVRPVVGISLLVVAKLDQAVLTWM